MERGQGQLDVYARFDRRAGNDLYSEANQQVPTVTGSTLFYMGYFEVLRDATNQTSLGGYHGID